MLRAMAVRPSPVPLPREETRALQPSSSRPVASQRDRRRPRCYGLSPPGTLGCARTEALCTLPLSLMMRPIS
jgi:hypothetical protein